MKDRGQDPLRPFPPITGFNPLRVLASRSGSAVILARDAAGKLGALKLHGPHPTAMVVELAARLRALHALGPKPGLLTILALGATPEGYVWEWLPLGDNLPDLPALTTAEGVEDYSPLSLRARITELGPAPAQQVARWGLQLAAGLTALHSAGWVHRDVKPGNVLFVNGEPCLADYGLTGSSGGGAQFDGTEGYRPLEGTSDAGADLFALGKTLYEAWTGLDRLEFPSLPKAIHDAPDWPLHGRVLNEALLRACHPEPQQRFESAGALAEALKTVVAGSEGVTRRRWLLAVAGIGALAIGGAGIWLARQRVRPGSRRVGGTGTGSR